MAGDLAEQLNDVGEMVLVAGVVSPTVRLKQVVAGGQLKGLKEGWESIQMKK